MNSFKLSVLCSEHHLQLTGSSLQAAPGRACSLQEFSNVNIGNIHIPGQAAVPASTYLTVQKSLFQFHNQGIEPHGSLQKGKEPDPDPGGGDPPC